MTTVDACKNSFQCWMCKEKCNIKHFFELPYPIFVDYMEQALKAGAGLMLAKGCSFDQVEKEKKIMTLTLITSRKKYLEMKSKSN